MVIKDCIYKWQSGLSDSAHWMKWKQVKNQYCRSIKWFDERKTYKIQLDYFKNTELWLKMTFWIVFSLHYSSQISLFSKINWKKIKTTHALLVNQIVTITKLCNFFFLLYYFLYIIHNLKFLWWPNGFDN